MSVTGKYCCEICQWLLNTAAVKILLLNMSVAGIYCCCKNTAGKYVSDW